VEKRGKKERERERENAISGPHCVPQNLSTRLFVICRETARNAVLMAFCLSGKRKIVADFTRSKSSEISLRGETARVVREDDDRLHRSFLNDNVLLSLVKNSDATIS